MVPHRRVALSIAVVLLASACAKESTQPTDLNASPTRGGPASTPAGAFVPAPISWEDCDGVECATLAVPLDYSKPDDETIELYITRVPAGGERYGALFVNPGGPGAPASDFASYVANRLPDVAEHYDILGMDPRGVGGSTPIRCGIDLIELYGVDPTIDSPADRAAILEVTERYVTDCAKKYPDLLAHLGTADVARDMDTVRAAMDDERLSYLGYSYGTAIGQEYARLFPSHINKMVLDGAVPLGPSGLEQAGDQALGFETGLDRYAAHCNADPECPARGRALESVEEALALAEQPGGIPAPKADRPAGPGEASLGISYAMYSEDLWYQLDQAVSDALGGDGSGLVALADSYLEAAGFEVYFAVSCLDFSWPSGDLEAFFAAATSVAETAPHFGEALVLDYLRCAQWPVAPVPLAAVTAPDAPPILVISTTGDPATPYASGVAVAETLARGVLITNEGDGHTVVGNGKDCIDDLVIDYLINNVVPKNGTTCP